MFFLLMLILLNGHDSFCVKVLHPHAAPVVTEHNQVADVQVDGKKRDKIPTLVADSSEGFNDEERSRNLVVYYSFETFFPETQKIKDESSFDNNGIMDVGGIILQMPGSSCKSAAYLWDQSIKISFSTPDGAPKYGVSIAMWIKFQTLHQIHKVFETRGFRFGIMTLLVHGDHVIFSYKPCVKCPDYFRVQGKTTLKRDWFHLVATYNATTGIAQLYVDGWPLNRTWNKDAEPFHYWGADVRIGANGSPNSLRAFIDEFRLYSYALSSQEAGFLALSCSYLPTRSTSSVSGRSDINQTPGYSPQLLVPADVSDLDIGNKKHLNQGHAIS